MPNKKLNKNLIDYYKQRAKEYEKIYNKPERQQDISEIKGWLQNEFAGKEVLEIACGTGYWTQSIANAARQILATDINQEVLDVARQKEYRCPTDFIVADVYSLSNLTKLYESGFGGFIWSHIPNPRVREFLEIFHSKIMPGGEMVFIDNAYVEGSNTPIAKTDEQNNTYQLRKLDDGTEHMVLKNFPSDQQIYSALSGFAADIHIKRLEYYWILSYKKLP